MDFRNIDNRIGGVRGIGKTFTNSNILGWHDIFIENRKWAVNKNRVALSAEWAR